MRKVSALIAATALVVVAACENPLDGLAKQIEATARVATASCSPDTLDIVAAEGGSCQAQNEMGAYLVVSGVSALPGGWSSTDEAVVAVTVEGTMTPGGTQGGAQVCAHGSQDTMACDSVWAF